MAFPDNYPVRTARLRDLIGSGFTASGVVLPAGSNEACDGCTRVGEDMHQYTDAAGNVRWLGPNCHERVQTNGI